MYYEVYLDSVFLLCLCMNRCLLGLTCLCLSCTATRARLWAGAALGAAGELLAIVAPAPFGLVFLAVSFYGMAGLTFRCWRGRGLVRIAEGLCACFFLLGGALTLLLKLLPGKEGWLSCSAVILLMAAASYEGIRLLVLCWRKNRENCRVTLHGADGHSVRIEGLVDTGNSLREPISGRPVAVLEKRIWEELYPRQQPPGMRVIPYHSVGKPAGTLIGFPVGDMEVEIGGIRRKCREIYIAIWQERLSETGTYNILLQPSMLEG